MGDYWSCLRGFTIVRTEYSEAEPHFRSSFIRMLQCVWGRERWRKSLSKKSLLRLPKDLLYEEVAYYQIEFTYRKKQILEKKICTEGVSKFHGNLCSQVLAFALY